MMAELSNLEKRLREEVRKSLVVPKIFAEFLAERERQDEQFGKQNHHPAYWLAIVGKQIGQMGAAILDREWAADPAAGTAKVRAEAVQAAAVLVAFIECIDEGKMPIGLETMPQGRQRAHALGVGDEALRYDEPEYRPLPEPDPNDDEQRTT
jgi:hypothetical protein